MDADERDEWMAYYALTCPRCGNLRSECSDETRDWHPQESICWAAATREWGERRLREEHKDFDPKARDHRGELLMSPLDGVHVWVADVDFAGMREDLGASVAEQPIGGDGETPGAEQ